MFQKLPPLANADSSKIFSSFLEPRKKKAATMAINTIMMDVFICVWYFERSHVKQFRLENQKPLNIKQWKGSKQYEFA